MKFEPIVHNEPVAPQRIGLRRQAVRTVSARHLLAFLLLVLVAGNQLLLRFLDVAPPLALAAGAAGAALLLFMLRLPMAEDARIGLGRLAACIGLAALIFALGGEGRLFYANTDWQIRDAVLRDMSLNPWPYAYNGRGVTELLRAPIGMYLIPSVAGKIGGAEVAHVAMLVQNSVLLGILLALGSLLAETARARAILLAVVVAFSGMDILDKLRLDPAAVRDVTSHLDGWSPIQFSSHITQAFWVPQHAIAGWTGAVLFLLWAKGRLPLVAFLVPLPLLALWSPLSLMGVMPFAAYAGLATLLRRQLKPRDVIAPLAAAALAVPALIYLQAAGDTVGMRPYPLRPLAWLNFHVLETLPFLVGVGLLATGRQPRLLLALTGAWLAIVPLVQVGTNVDFMMRASIPALAILAVLVADALASRGGEYRSEGRLPRGVLIAALAIGAFTGLHEIARAFAYQPTPLTRCELIQTTVYHGGPNGPAGMTGYLAPVAALPERLRPEPVAIVPPSTGVRCWERPWKVPR